MKEARDWNRMIDILKKEVVPATGCTEPISLAFASAVAAEKLGIPVRKIEARVSANMMKNGMGVYVPGTGMPGLYIAAAVGAAGGDPTAGLQVLKNLSPAAVDKAKKLVADGQVTVDIADVPNILYSESKVYGDGHTVRVCIADNHTHVIRIERDDNVIFRIPESNNAGGDPETTFLNNLTLEDIYVFATQSPLADIAFIKEAATLNTALAEAGLTEMRALIFELRPEALRIDAANPSLTAKVEITEHLGGSTLVHARTADANPLVMSTPGRAGLHPGDPLPLSFTVSPHLFDAEGRNLIANRA